MENLIVILFMIVVGSIIAGSTNHLAIQMLFRPYKAKYIGKWRVPFTPGLIPRRRDELAIQIGKTVEDNLMTPEMVRNKVINDDVRVKMENVLKEYLDDNFFNDEKSIKDYLLKFGMYDKVGLVENKIDLFVEDKVLELKEYVDGRSLKELLGDSTIENLGRKIPDLSKYILSKGVEYIESEDGDKFVKNLVDNFLSSKGKFGGMVNMFMGDSSMVNDKIKAELVKLINSEQTYVSLVRLLIKEFLKFSDNKLEDIIDIDDRKLIVFLQGKFRDELDLEGRLSKKVSYYITDLDEKVKYGSVPKLVDYGLSLLDRKIENLLKSLDVQGMVKEQVDGYPVEELENILLGVSKKEFKMITYLGFVLGAFIGLFQGLFVILI